MRVFNETQWFNQWFMQLINYGMIAFLLYCLYMWFIAKSAVGNVMETDVTGQIVVIVAVVFSVLLLLSFKLKTKIDEVGIHYKFLPIHRNFKIIRWDEMESCEVRTYNAITEYGGWGFKGGFGKGTAFNVKGNIGIQIVLKSGKRILIGTQKENDAKLILKRYKNKENEGI